MTNIVVLTAGSTITGVQTATILDSNANAINQLSASQTALMNQVVAILYANIPPPPPTLHYQPPIQQLALPVQQAFSMAASGGLNPRNEGSGRGGHSKQGYGSWGASITTAHRLQTTATHKVSEALAKAAVAGDSFHKPQECSLHMPQILGHLMHGLLPCLSQTQ
jgi:hypothetical protein